MQLRLATAADVPVLQSWDEKPHVVAATGSDGSFDWAGEVSRTVPWREILIGEAHGMPVGVLVIIDPETEETHYWGEIGPNLRAIDIWIGEEPDLGRGYGSAMMQLALDRCFADPAVTGVLIDPLASNVRAHRFYERIGFTKIDRRTFGEDDCFIHRINKDAWESKA